MKPSKFKVLTYAISTVFSKGLSQLVVNKLISTSFGPAGMGVYGLWQNFSQILASFSNGSTNNGIIVSVSKDRDAIREVLKSAMGITLIFALALSLLSLVFYPYLSNQFFEGKVSVSNIVLLAACLPLIGWGICLSNVQNGLQSTNDQLLTNVAVPVFYIGAIWLATRAQNLGMVISCFTLAQAAPLFILFFFLKKRLGYWPVVPPKFTSATKVLLSHSSMSVAFSLSFPLATLIIREKLLQNAGLETSGYFDSLLRLSSIGFALISAMVSIYFLPNLAAMPEEKIFPHYVRTYKYLFVMYGTGIIGAATLAPQLMALLYSEKFLPAAGLLLPLVVGDLFKTLHYVNLNFLVSRNKARPFILIEFGAAALYLLLCFLSGFTVVRTILFAYIFTYFLSSVLSVVLLKKLTRNSL